MEYWKTVKNFPDYEVSTLGNVRGKKRMKNLKFDYTDNGGYCRVKLRRNNFCQKFVVHRLVAQEFIGDITNFVVDHVNRIRTDNRLENLRIVNQYENCKNKGIEWKNINQIKMIQKLTSEGKSAEEIFKFLTDTQ
jgi:hypothetical protein